MLCHPAHAQRAQASGAVTITNKGISLIPALTLGKPAAIFDVAITDGALSFQEFLWNVSLVYAMR